MIDTKLKKIVINSSFKDYKYEESETLDLKSLNIFVGTNNSGKSRFIRQILNKGKYSFYLENNSFKQLYKEMHELLEDIMNQDFTALINNYSNSRDIILKFMNTDSYQMIAHTHKFEEHENVLNQVETLYRNNVFRYKGNIKIEELRDTINLIKNSHKNHLLEYKNLNMVYIPTLRGLRNLDYICQAKIKIEECFKDAKLERDVIFSNDFYTGRTLLDYWPEQKNAFVIPQNNYYDYSKCEDKIGIKVLTGLNLFNDLTDMLLGSPGERETIKKWQIFLENNFFDDQVTITPNRSEGIVKVKIGNEPELGIHNLGDGLQTIIILTFSLFKYMNRQTLLVIEEPELYLHPGYQRKLVEVLLMDDFKNIQYLITTHSNHFLDLTIDYPDQINIYNMKKSKEIFYIDKRSDESSIDLLKNLGVRPSSLFLSNAVIMVEGISDIIYIKIYLQVYMESENIKKYDLDKHYTFLESAGSNIIHWDFLDGPIKTDKILPNVFIVTDDDNELAKLNSIQEEDTDLSEKQKRLLKLKERQNCHILKVREIENLISPQILKKTIINRESNYKNKKRVIDESLIPDFIYEEYKTEYLGKFIDKKLRKLRNNVQKTYKYGNQTSKGGSGTISNKVGFSNLVVKNIKEFKDLTEEAKELTKKLYCFIESNNK